MTHHTSAHDFLATWDKDAAFLKKIVELAARLKKNQSNSKKFLSSGMAVSIFRDKSTRTRYSFAAAASMLGLTLFDFDESKSQIAHGETVEETAAMVGFLSRVVGIRDDIYLGVGHKFMTQFSRGLDWGFDRKVLPVRPTVINLQSDEDHPTQSVSDLAHLVSYFGSFAKLRGKKITISWVYSPSYGKPMSVPQGAIALLTRFGMNVTLAHPNGYNLMPSIEEYVRKEASKSGGRFTITNDINKSFTNADIVYPKSWAPFSVMEKRTKYLKQGNEKKLASLEKEGLKQNAKYKQWTCTEKLMRLTSKALYMHCLPADITGINCKQGEVEESVFQRFRKAVYDQASFKPYVIAAMILLCQNVSKSKKSIQKLS